MERVALVHRNLTDARRAVRELGIVADPIGWGSNPCGRSYDKIIILFDWRSQPPVYKQWLFGVLHCRIHPNGRIVDLT